MTLTFSILNRRFFVGSSLLGSLGLMLPAMAHGSAAGGGTSDTSARVQAPAARAGARTDFFSAREGM